MRWLLPTLFALFAFAAPAHAERVLLVYEGKAWGVAPLGEAMLDLTLVDERYRVGARLTSGGLLKLFDNSDLVASAEGGLGAAGPSWARYDLDHAYAKKRRVTAMRAEDGAVNVAVAPVYGNLGKPPASDEQKRAARDPLSSILAMSLQIASTRSCKGEFLTFDGRHLYNLSFSGGEMGRYETDGYDGPVLKCVVHYIPVAGFDPKEAKSSKKKAPKAQMWFALEGGAVYAAPVKFVLPIGLGQASISLKSVERPSVTIDDESDHAALSPPNPLAR